MNKFKVGDTVIVEDSAYSFNGEKGTIISVGETCCIVKVGNNHLEDGRVVEFDNLRLVKDGSKDASLDYMSVTEQVEPNCSDKTYILTEECGYTLVDLEKALKVMKVFKKLTDEMYDLLMDK